jgi:transposase
MKYSYEKKLRLVLLVVREHHSIKQLAKSNGMHHEQLRRWVSRYEAYGAEGLGSHRFKYDVDFKMSVLRYMHENRLSLKDTAVKFMIPAESTILQWDRLYAQEGLAGLSRDNRGKMKKPKQSLRPKPVKTKEEEFQAELEYLRAENAYLKKLRALVEERIARESGSEQKPSKD